MKKKLYWILGLVIVVILVLLLAIIMLKNPREKEAIKVGAVLPLSGPLADLGNSELQGLLLAQEEIGEDDILINFEDGQADPQKSLDAANNLVNLKGVKYLITSFRGASLAVASGLKDSEAIIFAYTATTENGPIGFENGNFFPIGAEMISSGKIVGRYARENNLCTAVGILAENSPTGKDKAEGFKLGFNEPAAVVLEQYFDPISEKSFKTQIAKFKADKVNCLFIEIKPGTSLGLYKEMVELDFKPLILANSYSITPNVLENDAAKIILEGAVFSSNGLIKNESNINFFKSYEQTVNKSPDEFSAIMYDFIHLINDLDNSCVGSLDCVKQELRGSGFKGKISGDAKIMPTGDGFLTEYYLKQVKNGGLTVVQSSEE